MLLKLKSTPEVPIEAPTICTDRFKARKKDEIKKLNQTIYLVSEKKNIKNKILENLENQLIKNG